MELKFILEAILFSAQKPLNPLEIRALLATAAEQTPDDFARALKKTPVENIVAALEELQREHEAAARTYRLACVAGAWQFVTQPEFAPWMRAMHGPKTRPPRLTQPALETLAIIAYRQPVTRAQIEEVRGVAVDGVMQTLLDRGLVVQSGRAEVAGRPSLYSTAPAFLDYFGLGSLNDLPAADELRRVPIEKPVDLLTVDPGLATAVPAPLAEATPAESNTAAASKPSSSRGNETQTNGDQSLLTSPATSSENAAPNSDPAPAVAASDESVTKAAEPSGVIDTAPTPPPRPRTRSRRGGLTANEPPTPNPAS